MTWSARNSNVCGIVKPSAVHHAQDAVDVEPGVQRLVYTYSLTAIFAAPMAAFPFSSDNAVVFTQLKPDCTLTK